MPRVIAARAGAKIEPAIPVRACSTEIDDKAGENNGIASDPAVIVIAPAMMSARLAVVLSTHAPAGPWATIAPMPPTAMTNPIDAWSQCWASRR